MVEFELATWPELKHAIRDERRTTVLLFNGGTEQRGPQEVVGAHNLVSHESTREIAAPGGGKGWLRKDEIQNAADAVAQIRQLPGTGAVAADQ